MNVYVVTRGEWGWEGGEDKVVAVFSSLEIAYQYINAEVAPFESRRSYEVYKADHHASVSSVGNRSIGGVADWNLMFDIVEMPVLNSVPVKQE